MKASELRRLEKKLEVFLDEMLGGLGRRERVEALSHYVEGLLLDGKRKSIEPMAMRLASGKAEVQAVRQRLQRAVSVASWDENIVFERLAKRLDGAMPGIEAWSIDDTGFPKCGNASVGVKRQYSGTLGKVGNCQVMTSLHLCGESSSACIGARLFLPKEWSECSARRERANVPEDVVYKSKLDTALDLLDNAMAWGLTKRVVLADAGFGKSRQFREALTERGLKYIVGVESTMKIWPPGSDPHLPRQRRRGRPRTRYIGKNGTKAKSLASFAQALATDGKYRRISFRQGTDRTRHALFWTGRVRTADKHTKGKPPSKPLWLIIEHRTPGDYRCHVSNLPASTSRKELVRQLKLRWRIEQDYREMKDELGLDHFEGRTWPGFHHHVAMCAVAFGFLALQRALFSPEKKASAVHRPTATPSAAKGPARVAAHLPALSVEDRP